MRISTNSNDTIGSGKSTISLTCWTIPGDITIVGENSLDLSFDQTSKNNSLVTSSSKDIKAYYLDVFKVPHEHKKWCYFKTFTVQW